MYVCVCALIQLHWDLLEKLLQAWSLWSLQLNLEWGRKWACWKLICIKLVNISCNKVARDMFMMTTAILLITRMESIPIPLSPSPTQCTCADIDLHFSVGTGICYIIYTSMSLLVLCARSTMKVTIGPTRGTFSGQPEKRNYQIAFPNFWPGRWGQKGRRRIF